MKDHGNEITLHKNFKINISVEFLLKLYKSIQPINTNFACIIKPALVMTRNQQKYSSFSSELPSGRLMEHVMGKSVRSVITAVLTFPDNVI